MRQFAWPARPRALKHHVLDEMRDACTQQVRLQDAAGAHPCLRTYQRRAVVLFENDFEPVFETEDNSSTERKFDCGGGWGMGHGLLPVGIERLSRKSRGFPLCRSASFVFNYLSISLAANSPPPLPDRRGGFFHPVVAR